MKKSVIFLINGLGVEKPGSYSISIDQTMPNLTKTRETSYFTTAVISSLEYRSAYQNFFLGNTYEKEIEYIKDKILGEKLPDNEVYKKFINDVSHPESKLHFFVEPTNNHVVEEINRLVNTLTLEKNKKIYMHLLLTQQTVNEYDKLISIINYIKFHINEHITVGFVIGKESISEEITKEELDYTKKLLFMCSAERWSETEVKLNNLKAANIRPCEIKGFCTNNDCFISNNDTIMFFNTRGENYDNILESIYENSKEVFKIEPNLPIYSLIKLNTKYNISPFSENIEYDNSLANQLEKYNKKALIITDAKNMNIVNFYANGLKSVNNPIISFMLHSNNLYNKEYINQLIDNSAYDLFIFDFHMDVSKTVNDLKNQLAQIDIIIGLLADVCVNKHSLFISSLYGIRKQLPLADYNQEMVLLNYEMQIPIFFFDYTYPRAKYDLFPGETNDILSSAIKCIVNDEKMTSLVRKKTVIGSILKSIAR